MNLENISHRMPEIEAEFGLDFNEKDAFIDLDHYRRLVHTYVDMVSMRVGLGDVFCFDLKVSLYPYRSFSDDTRLHCIGRKKCPR